MKLIFAAKLSASSFCRRRTTRPGRHSALRARLIFLAALLLFTAACERHRPAPTAPQGITWREGSVEEAFAEAGESHQPVLLYWGAKWCPPCNQLQAAVFQRPAFVEQTRQFIDVHLDGDSPGAQQWGEYFGISGYPTLIILRADRSELTRLSGSSDVEQYPRLLALALRQTQPIRQILQEALTQPQKLRADDWQSLGGYGWEIDQQKLLPEQNAAAVLDQLAQRCPDAALKQSFALQALTQRANASGKKPVETERSAGRQLLRSVLADAASVRRNLALVESEGADWVAAVVDVDSADYAQLASLLITAMDRSYDDVSLSVGERINSSFAELDLWKHAHSDQPVPKALAEKIRRRAQWADAQARTPYERQNAIDAAAELLKKAGLHQEAHQLLLAEIGKSVAPYYHMVSLAQLAEEDGDKAAAIDWLRKAYAGAQGPATRAQWGVLYVEGLIRMAPDDAKTIQTATAQLISEVAASHDGYYQRTRKRFERLSGELIAWSEAHQGEAQLAALRTQMQPLCVGLPEGSGAKESCGKFLQMEQRV